MPRIHNLKRPGHRLLLIGHYHEMRKIGLGSLGGFQVVIGNHDKPSVACCEILMAFFELAELGHTDQSPAASKEKQDGGTAMFEIDVRER